MEIKRRYRYYCRFSSISIGGIILGYIVLKAKEDMYIKEKESHFIYKKDNIYVAKYYHNDIKIFDERDNACYFGFYRSC